MRSFGDIQFVCKALFELTGIRYTIYIYSNCFLVKFWAGKKNKKYGELCENFIDSFPDAYFLKSQPKRTTFHVPVFTNL